MSQIYSRPALTSFHETSPYVFDKIRPDQYLPRALDLDRNIAYSHPERGNEGSSLTLAGKIPPMSEQKRGLYEVPAARVGDDYQTRPEISQRPPREQLPPLSSLFSTPHPGGPTPFIDRSPTFPPNVSPRDPRRSSLSVKSLPEPTWEATNIQRHPSQTSPRYSYDGRPSQSSQSELPPPPPRTLHVNRQPHSPRFYEPRFSPQEGAGRTQLPTSRSGWSPRSEPPFREYFPPVSRDSSSSFRPQLELQQPLQPPSHRRESDARQSYREAPLPATTASQFSSATASPSSDSVTTKDGLGPKIWTGTQFLPRYVRSAEVAGEGLCFFYDDGTHCKTHIDGEAVNAHWGVTKAGKPRKRLAIACITCREKKIKCDPDYPRCIQCEKFGRICKFKNAPRGGQGSPETPSHDAEDLLTRPVSQRSDEETQFKAEKRGSAHSIPSQINDEASPEQEAHAAKRRRLNDFNPLNVDTEAGYLSQNASPVERKPSVLTTRKSSEQLFAQWTTSPYDTDEELVMELMKMYFANINSSTYDMFPEKPFMEWLSNRSADKSKDDLMLIYTMLALATVFSTNPEHKQIGEAYAAISRYACDNRHFSLQLVQSRLLLAMYYYANNNPNDSWDFCGSALRAATGMKLNQEIEKTEDNERDVFPFNLNRHGFAECRRRTFWSAFIIDRFNGFCSGHVSILHPDDVFLRLPCDVKSFNAQVEVNNPYFDANTYPASDSLSTLGAMAYLVNITSIWGDVMANVYRASQRPASSQPQKPSTFMNFYETITARLHAWHLSVPDYLAHTPENIEKLAKFGSHNVFLTMHSLYHITHIKLNRYVSPELLTAVQLEHNIRTAHGHADAVLRLLDNFAAVGVKVKDFDMPMCSSPFVGYAVISAVDILSAKGTMSALAGLPGRFRGATRVMGELAQFWQSARNQKEMMAARVVDLCRVEEGWRDGSVVKVEGDGSDAEKKWAMLVPLERTFAMVNDCIYATGFGPWERALGGN